MNIAKFSELTSLTPHTLRYYEKLGLLTNISRTTSGHRSYSQADVEWARFISRLKETGMPLEQILEYGHLRAQGDGTVKQRRALLLKHRAIINARIENELEHLRMLDLKINYYDSLNP